jgi:3-oxoacyl-[acyl-carrier protein] reductase
VADIEAVATEIRQTGRKAIAISADVTIAQQVEDLVVRTKAEFGTIDILVNSAGGIPSELYGLDGAASPVSMTVWDTPEVVWDRMIASNLKSVYLCIKAVMPHMISQKRGDIINIVSQAGRVPYPLGGSYPAAKHAAMALTETVGLQAATYGIRVNAVSPGLVDTPGQRRLMTLFIPEDQLPPMDPPESIAAAVVYLLCDAPKNMTGQSLDLFKIVGGT